MNRVNAVALANENIGDPAVNLFAKRLMGDFADKSYGPLYDEKLAKDYLQQSLPASVHDRALGEAGAIHPLSEGVQSSLRHLSSCISGQQPRLVMMYLS